MNYADEGTVKVVDTEKTVEERILEGVDDRRASNQIFPVADVEVILGTSPVEIRARILNEATDLIEQAYENLRAAIDTLGICDIRAQEKYAGLVREMGKAVRDFSGKL